DKTATHGLPAVAEDLDVSVAEAVDGLELVSDRERLAHAGARQKINELALQAIRVLELVDHDLSEPELLPLSNGRVLTKEVARVELQVLEVKDGLGRLGRRILLGEALEQFLERVPVGGRGLVECSLL